jgi:hypothetical protein
MFIYIESIKDSFDIMILLRLPLGTRTPLNTRSMVCYTVLKAMKMFSKFGTRHPRDSSSSCRPKPRRNVLKAFTDIKNLSGNGGELRVGPCFVPSHGYSSV